MIPSLVSEFVVYGFFVGVKEQPAPTIHASLRLFQFFRY
jgi:hypothetical protein